MKLDRVLSYAVQDGASDIVFKTNCPPKCRIRGELVVGSQNEVVSPAIMQSWVNQLLPKHLIKKFEAHGEADFSYINAFGQRFRVNLFRQRQTFSAVLRVISNHIMSIDDLQLPYHIGELTKFKRGLVLVTGATGSGKSTTLSSLIDKINEESHSHIITIEDPIEYWLTDKNSTINQREIGVDTQTFSNALRAALRQNPDVILVGELRDKETIETALMAAETGHLVFSTLHTSNAVESLTRFMSYFPAEQEKAIRIVLSQNLRGVLSQRLVPRADGSGMIAAVEIMYVNALIRDIILNGEDFEGIHEAIKKNGATYGMQTFDQALLHLNKLGIIDQQTTIKFASNKDDVKLLLSGIAS